MLPKFIPVSIMNNSKGKKIKPVSNLNSSFKIEVYKLGDIS